MSFLRVLSGLAVATALSMSVAPAAAPARTVADGLVSTAPDAARASMNRRVFDQVWNEVRVHYYDPRLHGVDWIAARRLYRPEALAAPNDRALYRVLEQMLDLLDDSHATAIAPAATRRNDALRMRRPVMGVTLRRDDDNPDIYIVQTVRDGSPASEAGIEPGWRVDVSSPRAWSPELDVVEDQPVDLVALDLQGVRHTLTVRPRMMDPRPAFVADRSRPGVAVLRVEGFEPGLGRWIGGQLAATPVSDDIVLDLRGNPGGRLSEADAVLSCFLPRNRVWATRTSRTGRAVPLRTEGGCGDLAGPAPNAVAVLVDGDSRSAAELTPAALQEAGRAVVVGEATTGAVLISQETRLADGGKLTLSRSNFVTSGGVRLEKRGVQPDVVAPATPEDRRAGRDPALDAAIDTLARLRTETARAATPAVL